MPRFVNVTTSAPPIRNTIDKIKAGSIALLGIMPSLYNPLGFAWAVCVVVLLWNA